MTATSLLPALKAGIDEVLDVLGASGITEGVSAADLRHILAEIRFNMLLDTKLLFPNSFPGLGPQRKRDLAGRR